MDRVATEKQETHLSAMHYNLGVTKRVKVIIMQEIWKDVVEYEGLYQVSNLGNVRSLDRVEQCNGTFRQRKGTYMSKKSDKNGYLTVGLRDGFSQKFKKVHRLVAEAFIENPKGLPQVNHKDEDKTNNSSDNLEWCDSKYNVQYGTGIQRRSVQKRKCVVQCDLRGAVLREFVSVTEAAKSINKETTAISGCCKGIRKTAYGYVWKYKEAK